MEWIVEFDPKADKEFERLNATPKSHVAKAIRKVSQNPLPQSEGGYGKPLGNKQSSKLAGCLKIKLKRIGIRVVYKLIREDAIMKIIIISIRDDDEVYKEAVRRIAKDK
ncbi:MAG: type II toxin-antitoxin system RelE/ParE family toxin [Defluviitaleaceae bacterium]|nr:type II toxin-antitoxin system RelE/ParE family toxin [Defluviitaleaceae bacterium]